MFSSNTSQVVSASQAEAIDFNGPNGQYLTSTNSLSSTALTCSFWIWPDTSGSYFVGGNGYYFRIQISEGSITAYNYNTGSGTENIYLIFSPGYSGLRTFSHVVFSFDTSLSSSTAKCYINDQLCNTSIISHTGSYQATNITICDYSSTSFRPATRISNFFMKSSFTDLTVTANRRQFITADLKPAPGQASLNPLVYLPLNDPTQPGLNTGTGSNFTLTGTVARSGRGPNQYNAPASAFNGSTQYLSRATVGGQSKLLTIAFNVKDWSGTTWLLNAGVSASPQSIYIYGSGQFINLVVRNSSNTTVLELEIPSSLLGSRSINRWMNVVVSVDLNSVSNRHVAIDGQIVTSSCNFYTYTNANMDLSPGTTLKIGTRYDNTNFFSGKLSAFYLDQSYINLSVASNLAKFVSGTGINAVPVDLGVNGELPTGTSPLIYLPMYGGNAGSFKNYGTGGDFSPSGSPYIGSRGPNEFWGNGVTYSSTSSYLSNTGDSASSSTFTLSVWLQAVGTGATSGDPYVIGFGPGNSRYIYVYWTLNGGRQMYFKHFWPGGGASATSANFSVSSTGFTHLLVSKTGNTYQCYVDGSLVSMTVVGTVGNWVDDQKYINFGSSSAIQSSVGELFFTTQYFDLSQEANRLIFRDTFGYPTNLPLAITNQVVANPKYYLRFAPTSFGANSGTGGNFTINGSLLDKGQF